MRAIRGGCLTACLLLCASLVSAQEASPTAREVFDAATAAFEAGDFEAAASGFERCYEMTGEADLLYNIATAHDRLRNDEEALSRFREYLEARPDTEERAAIEARIRALESALEPHQGEDAGEQGTDTEGSAQDEGDQAAQADTTDAPTQDESGTDSAATTSPGDGAGPPAAALGLVIGGAVAVVAGAVLVGVGQADIAAVESSTSWPDVADANDRAPVLNGVGFGALAVGAVLVGAGVVLWATAGGDSTEAEVAVGPGTIRVRGSF